MIFHVFHSSFFFLHYKEKPVKYNLILMKTTPQVQCVFYAMKTTNLTAVKRLCLCSGSVTGRDDVSVSSVNESSSK